MVLSNTAEGFQTETIQYSNHFPPFVCDKAASVAGEGL